MSRRSKRRKPMAEINVVPYIDVTLVLLIIFMITTPLLQTGVEVNLPNAEAKTVEPKKDPPIIVSIDKDGQFFIDLGDNKEEPVQEEDVLVRVSAVIRNKPETPVFIRGDKNVDYGKVVTIMAALKNAGVPSVGLMTSPEK
jgi:biopolymer transport protein TolR